MILQFNIYRLYSSRGGPFHLYQSARVSLSLLCCKLNVRPAVYCSSAVSIVRVPLNKMIRAEIKSHGKFVLSANIQYVQQEHEEHNKMIYHMIENEICMDRPVTSVVHQQIVI